MIFLRLFFEFFKTGLLSVGGGLATLPFLKEIAMRYPWFTPEDLMDMIAVSESTPGPMGVNAASYAGFHAAGVPGAVMATFALVLPSVIVVILISRALTRFRDSKLVQDIFYGLRPASAGLIFSAIADIVVASLLYPDAWRGLGSLAACLNLPAIALFAGFLAAIKLFPKVHPVVFIAAGAAAGVLIQF